MRTFHVKFIIKGIYSFYIGIGKVLSNLLYFKQFVITLFPLIWANLLMYKNPQDQSLKKLKLTHVQAFLTNKNKIGVNDLINPVYSLWFVIIPVSCYFFGI